MRCVVDQWSWLGRRLPVGDSQWVGCTVLSSVAPEGGSLNASNRALPIVVICVRLRSAAVCSQHLHLPTCALVLLQAPGCGRAPDVDPCDWLPRSCRPPTRPGRLVYSDAWRSARVRTSPPVGVGWGRRAGGGGTHASCVWGEVEGGRPPYPWGGAVGGGEASGYHRPGPAAAAQAATTRRRSCQHPNRTPAIPHTRLPNAAFEPACCSAVRWRQWPLLATSLMWHCTGRPAPRHAAPQTGPPPCLRPAQCHSSDVTSHFRIDATMVHRSRQASKAASDSRVRGSAAAVGGVT